MKIFKSESVASLCALLFVIVLSHLPSGLSEHANQCFRDRCVVRSPHGSYRGLYNASILIPDCHYCVYTDIPYAVARRFEKPKLIQYVGPHVYDATRDDVECAQPQRTQNMSVAGTENCLFLNVYTPQTTIKTGEPLRAVIVFVHGGAYVFGSKSLTIYSPDFFMPQDIVLVAINYRLGAFGFLNLGIPECGGNIGIRDQIEALKWVRHNIEWFGGDKNRVTVMGESAGGISSYLLPLSPLSRGLITNGIISESPVYTDRINYDIMLKKTTEYYSIEFAKFMGYKGDLRNRHAILHFFQGLSVLDLVRGYTQYTDYLTKTSDIVYTDLPFVASVDCHIPGAVFPNTLEELGKTVPDPNLSVIYGLNDADGDYNTFTDAQVIADYILSNLSVYIRGAYPILAKDERTLKRAVACAEEYYNPDGTDNDINVSVEIETYFSYDNLYTRQLPVFRGAYSKNRVYLYEFRYAKGYRNFKDRILGEYADLVKGASHAEELGYLFFAPAFFPNGFSATRDELSLICRMTTWWANFAKTGDPNRGNWYNHCADTIWGPTSPAHDTYLQIGVKDTSRAIFVRNRKVFQEQRDFFERLQKFAFNNHLSSCPRRR